MSRPMFWMLNTSVHDGDVGVQSYFVGNTVTFKPLFGIDLVGTQHGACLIVKNFCSSSRQRGQTCLLHLGQIGV